MTKNNKIIFWVLATLMVSITILAGTASADYYNITAEDSYTNTSITNFTITTDTSYELTGDLTAFYPLGRESSLGTGNILDLRSGLNGTASGYAVNDGVVSGGVTINETTGAMVFDGVNGGVDIGGSGISGIKSFHIRLTSFDKSNGQRTIIGADSSWPTAIPIVQRSTTGYPYAVDFGSGLRNVWSHTEGVETVIQGTYNGSTWIFYQDGEHVLTFDSSDFSLDNINARFFGQRRFNDQYFNGSIKEIRFWSDSMTQTQFQAELGTAYAVRGDGLVGQWSGRDFLGSPASPTTILDKNFLVSTGVANNPVGWRGSNNNIALSSSTNTVRSFSVWLNPYLRSTQQVVLSGSTNFFLFYRNTNFWSTSISGSNRNIVFINNEDMNRWQNLVGIHNSTHWNFYYDNVFQTSVETPNVPTINKFFNNQANTNPFNGGISQVVLSTVAWSEEERLALYNEGAGQTYPFAIGTNTFSTTNGTIRIYHPTNTPTINIIANSNELGGYQTLISTINQANKNLVMSVVEPSITQSIPTINLAYETTNTINLSEYYTNSLGEYTLEILPTWSIEGTNLSTIVNSTNPQIVRPEYLLLLQQDVITITTQTNTTQFDIIVRPTNIHGVNDPTNNQRFTTKIVSTIPTEGVLGTLFDYENNPVTFYLFLIITGTLIILSLYFPPGNAVQYITGLWLVIIAIALYRDGYHFMYLLSLITAGVYIMLRGEGEEK